LVGDEVPHIFTRRSRLKPGEFLITSAKRLLQHNPSNSDCVDFVPRTDAMCQPRSLPNAIAQAGALLKMDCPTYRPITAVVRIGAMEQRLDAMLRAITSARQLALTSATQQVGHHVEVICDVFSADA
jgi:hypothetical protein